MAENTPEDTPNFIELAGDITIAWLQNPNVNPGIEDVPAFLRNVHAAIAGLTSKPAPEPEAVAHEPAASVRGSVKADYLVSLIDGKKYKTLKRHLAANGLTPDDYRERYGLKPDYPMVAASFAEKRREIAAKIGLGRKRVAPADAVPEAALTSAEEVAPAKPKRVARKARSAAVTVEPGTQEAVAVTPKRAAAKAKSSTSTKEGANKSGRKTARASAAEKPVRAKKTAVNEGTSPAPQE